MRIAGIDPGTIHTGVGILDEAEKGIRLVFSGTIHAPAAKPLALRLMQIYQELISAFHEWKPEVVALENIFYQKDFKAAVKVGEARAAAMLAASECGIPVIEYPPARVKESISGNGRASKNQIQYMVRRLLHLDGPLSADSADAIAVAFCHVHSRKYNLIQKEKQLAHV